MNHASLAVCTSGRAAGPGRARSGLILLGDGLLRLRDLRALQLLVDDQGELIQWRGAIDEPAVDEERGRAVHAFLGTIDLVLYHIGLIHSRVQSSLYRHR